jgi:hypothetical protein
MNLNPPSSSVDVSTLVMFVAPYVSKLSSEKIPIQHSGLRIRATRISFLYNADYVVLEKESQHVPINLSSHPVIPANSAAVFGPSETASGKPISRAALKLVL